MTALHQIQVACANFKTLEIVSPDLYKNQLFKLAMRQLQEGIEVLKREYDEIGP